jgi:peptidoglycan/LPS O-acetylase OafA/YrhL
MLGGIDSCFSTYLMTAHISAFLDLMRLLAALLVFIGHASGQEWTGGRFWQVGRYMDTAVVSFFVMSGYVIAYVVQQKETTARAYVAGRLARLWSVVVPALALTLVIDVIGVRVAPQYYIDRPWYAGDMLALRYLASLFFVNELWSVTLAPGINQPFWSLSYEAVYYLMFGLVSFAQGWLRWALLGLLALIAGPAMLALAPLWYLGAWLYALSQRSSVTFGAGRGLMLLAVGMAGLVLTPWARPHLFPEWTVLGETVGPRYYDGLCFAWSLWVVSRTHWSYSGVIAELMPRIQTLALMTFPLYLFHRPLIQFFTYSSPFEASSWARWVMTMLGTLAFVWWATPWCERLRMGLRARLLG